MKTHMINEDLIRKFKGENEQFFSGTEGYIYTKGDMVLKEYKRYREERELWNLQEKTNKLTAMGVNTPEIVDYINFKHSYPWGQNYASYILMKRAKGSPVYAENIVNLWTWLPDDAYNQNKSHLISKYSKIKAEELSDAKQEQYDSFVNDISTVLREKNFLIDKYGENIYYDTKQGFSLIDLVVSDNKYLKYVEALSEKIYDAEIKQLVSFVALDYVGDLLLGIKPDEKGTDPVKLIRPVFDKTEKALKSSDEQVERSNYPRNLKTKLYDFIK